MKRGLFIGLGILCVGLLAAAVFVGARQWSIRLLARELEEARQAEAAGEVRVAAEHYERYRNLAGASADPDVLVERALIALKLASLPDALPKEVGWAFGVAGEAIPRRPADMRLRRRLADLQIARGAFAGAREHLLLIRESIDKGTADEDPAAIDLCLARTWLGTGDERQALAIVGRLTEFDIDARAFGDAAAGFKPASGAYLLLAEILRGELDDPAAADAAVEACLRAHPDDPAALTASSRLMLSRHDPPAALQAAARAVALAPDHPEAVLAHAQALAATGDHQAADIAFLDGVRRMPAERPLFAAAARHVAVHGAAEQVLELLDAAWPRLPFQEHAVLAFLVNMRIDWKSRPEFIRRLEEASSKLGADNAAVIVLEARVREAQGEWSAAEKSLVKARSLVPQESKRRIDELLARSLIMLGEADEAIVVCQRLERDPATWWRATSGIAEAHLDLGQREAAAEAVGRLCSRWKQGKMAEKSGKLAGTITPTLSPMIRVTAAQPASRRDWSVLDQLTRSLAESSKGGPDSRLVIAQAELLAAKGDPGAAWAVLPVSTDAAPSAQFDPLRIALIEQRDGIEAMRAALAALPRYRRERGDVLAAAVRAEARQAAADDRAWLRSCAAASAGIASADEAVQLLQQLARLAQAAGWPDEARALWTTAAARLPDDFRAHLALAVDAARRGDAAAAAAATARVVAIEGTGSPRGRVAAAAAIIASVRGKSGVRSMSVNGAADARDKRLEEAKALLMEAGNDRKRWQPVAVLLADVALLSGDPAAAAAHLQAALDDGPGDPRLCLELAAALDRCLRRGEAERLRDTVAPAGVGGGDRLAIDGHLRAGDHGAAAERAVAVIDAEKATKADTPKLLWLSRLCSRAGLRERATALAARATQLDAVNPDAWLRLVECRLAEDGEAAANAVLAQARDAVPPQQHGLLAARGDAVVGRATDAERGLREVVRQAGNNAVAAGFLVDLLMQQGREKDAETFLQEVISGQWGERPVLQKWAEGRVESLRDGERRS